MLVLSRKTGQRILIPELSIVISVEACSTGRVRIGIEAPRGIEIFREELLEAIVKRPAEVDPAERPEVGES